MSTQYDAIVIGSGFGGAVAACRLAEVGANVLVLERGRRWEPDAYPRDFDDAWLFDADCPQTRNGWFEFHIFPNMIVATGAGVGGGSLVYANVSEIPPEDRFERGWPEQITLAELQKYYDVAGEMLNVQEIPDNQLTRRYRLMQEAVDEINRRGNDPIERKLEKMHVAVSFDKRWSYDLPENERHTAKASFEYENAFGKRQGTCIHVGMCDVGCPVQAKNTLDLNYLARAESQGAEIRPLHLVRHIEPDGARGGYRVYYQYIGAGEYATRTIEQDFERARVVVLGAGSLGSTELLLRCRDQYQTLPYVSQFLGRDWSANGNWLTPGLYNVDDPEHGRLKRRISPTYGPTITARISYLDGEDENQERFTVEEGGVPPLLRGYLQSRMGAGAVKARNWRTKLALRALDKRLRDQDELKHVMPWFANGVDAANGRLYLTFDWLHPWRGKRLQMDWDIAKSRKLIDRIIDKHRELSEATGGRVWVPPTWKYLHDLITPHPLGGCNMGTGPHDGVVDHTGKVFGHDGLYVLDGAVVPEAIGINPSRTIAALAERNVRFVIEAIGRTAPKTPWTPPKPQQPQPPD
jgi:cholesterol oxidase